MKCRDKRYGCVADAIFGHWLSDGLHSTPVRLWALTPPKIPVPNPGPATPRGVGFAPLSQKEALVRRGGRLRNVTLDGVLADQLLRINRFTHRGCTYPFDLEDAHEAIRRLKPAPDRPKGLRSTNQDVYDTLLLGTTITKSVDGDSKSYSFRFIDWKQPDNTSST